MTDRASGRSRWSAAAGLAIGCLALPAVAQETSQASALAVARSGDAVGALTQLRALLAREPDDLRLRADTVVVANWAGDDAFAIELVAAQPASPWPADALEAAARSARNRGDYRRAAVWFDAAAQRDPKRSSAVAGAAMSLIEAGDAYAANARADRVLAIAGEASDLNLAVAYVRLRSGRAMEALALYQRVLAREPALREAADGVRSALADLGATQAAQAQDSAGMADPARLSTDRVAQAIRWSDYAPEDPDDRFAEARAALALADENLAALPASAAGQRRRARLDRVLALRRLERMDAAAAEAQALHDEDPALPAYVRTAWADALLYLRRPHEAVALYQGVLRDEPEQTEIELSLMYAQLEAEDFAAARRTLDAAIAHSPAWTRAPGPAQPLPNTDRARADIALALLFSFGDDLEEAQRRLEALLAEAPARTELQRELATIYLRRGWPRRALAHYRIAQSLDRENTALRLDLIAVQRRLGRFAAIEPALRALEADDPTNVHVQRQRADWDASRGWQLDLGARDGQGDSAVFGNRERTREVSLSSPLFAGYWRVFAQQHRQDADIPEGRVAHDRRGLGLRFARDAWDARVAAFDPRDGHSQRRAVEAALDWSPADTWRFGAQWSSASTDAPLRARYYGITGRQAAVSATWQRSDLGDVTWGLNCLSLSDGNRRDGTSVAVREQVVTLPHFKLDLRGALGASRNRLDEAPYFNPSRDATGTVGLAGDWTIWRRYDYRLQQRFGLWSGSYWQQSYGRSGVLRADVEHEWQFGPGIALRYGIGWFRQAYDGRRESRREVFAALHWGGMP